jgi:hypothetical protein
MLEAWLLITLVAVATLIWPPLGGAVAAAIVIWLVWLALMAHVDRRDERRRARYLDPEHPGLDSR